MSRRERGSGVPGIGKEKVSFRYGFFTKDLLLQKLIWTKEEERKNGKYQRINSQKIKIF